MSESTPHGEDRTRAIGMAAVGFAILWAIHVQADFASYRSWWNTPWSIACVVASLAVLLRPRSLPLLVVSGVAYIAAWIAHLPTVPNHETIGSFVATSVAIAYASTWRSESGRAQATLYERFAPAARGVLLWMYFWAVFHKLNRDFLFSAEVTCAARLYEGFRELVPLLPSASPGFELTMAWGTVAIEAGIPILLMIPRTRLLGIAVGWSFHLLLSFNPASGFYNFSSLLFPLFLLFAPPAFYGELRELAARVVPATRWARLARVLPGAAVAAIVVGIAVASDRDLSKAIPRHFGLLIWGLFSLPVTVVVFRTLWCARRRETVLIGSPAQVPRIAWTLPALMLLWGATPYLGLKTENSLSMFSNLRTELESNHLLVPAAAKLFDYQGDAVTVLAFSRDGEVRRPGRPLVMPYEEFRSWLARRRVDRVRYRRGGTTLDATPDSDAELFEPAWWTRKLMTFRPYEAPGPMRCVH